MSKGRFSESLTAPTHSLCAVYCQALLLGHSSHYREQGALTVQGPRGPTANTLSCKEEEAHTHSTGVMHSGCVGSGHM